MAYPEPESDWLDFIADPVSMTPNQLRELEESQQRYAAMAAHKIEALKPGKECKSKKWEMREYDENDHMIWAEMYRNGVNPYQIALKRKIAASTIHHYLKRNPPQ